MGIQGKRRKPCGGYSMQNDEHWLVFRSTPGLGWECISRGDYEPKYAAALEKEGRIEIAGKTKTEAEAKAMVKLLNAATQEK